MKKKHFIFTVLIIAIAIFSILPITNYILDPSRVLHHDYKTQYAKFHPHKLFLKVDYLLENKEKFDTLVYGSSRGRFVDVQNISKNAYNMSHGFGTVTTYLHTLKILLDNGFRVKNVWIGINDFDIWKEHRPNLHRLINKNNFFLDIPIYSHWLFRFLPESVKILKNDYPLLPTQEITNTHSKILHARQGEKSIQGRKNRNIPPATLGYTGTFRVDNAIEEVAQIKALCDDYNINLTVWFYPIYYKTYLAYNQNKIEDFKYKLAKVTNFHDFYSFDALSQNENNWFEGSHFTPTTADYMIKSIQENKFLVTSQTIDARIKQTRENLKSLVLLKLPNKGEGKGKGLYIDPYSDMNMFKKIFDSSNHIFDNTKQPQYSLTRVNANIEAKVKGIDPIVMLDKIETNAKHVMLTVSIKSQQKALFQLFFKENPSDAYAEGNTYYHTLREGENNFRIIFLAKYINNGLRIDFANKIGSYTIKKFTLRELNP